MIPIKEYFNETDSKVFYKDLETKRTKVGGQLTPLFDALLLSKFRADLYGAKQVEDKLLSFFHGKCAFCERFQSDETKRSKGKKRIWQIDHYRPKAGSNSYFWLVYECTNLLLSCFHCNFHKKELFEIIGKRAEIGDFLVNGKLDFPKCSISNEIFRQQAE